MANEKLKDEILQEVYSAQAATAEALQTLFDNTGLIATDIVVNPIDVSGYDTEIVFNFSDVKIKASV